MKDRGIKKWRGFNAVVPLDDILESSANIKAPEHSIEEIEEYEELLSTSLYTHSKIKVKYIENSRICELEDYVVKIDSIKKDVYFKTNKVNFRQVIEIKK